MRKNPRGAAAAAGCMVRNIHYKPRRGLRKNSRAYVARTVVSWSCGHFSAQKDREKDIAASVDRTRDLQIFSLTLSQLSYRGFNT